ncbi:hypothetical protein QUA54_00825 [Microcoleus sp. MOSTC5]|uniref:hypothetical protein n=1 Tax=Microcoleus sp. MOSTC5 TaxID=3055378 RepID=UPI002FD43E50
MNHMLGVALALGCCHRVAQAMGRSTMCELSDIGDRTDILHLCQQPCRAVLKKLIDKGATSVTDRQPETNVNFDTDNSMKVERHYLCDRT